MNIEFIWLAYDEAMVNKSWSELTIKDLYFSIIEDEFRRKVSPQIMLFHKRQQHILEYLEAMMKCGAINITLDEYKAYLFKNDIEEFPMIGDELFFDFQLICFYSTMRMADDFSVAERIISMILQRIGFLPEDQLWNTTILPHPDNYYELLRSITKDDAIEIAQYYDQRDPDFLDIFERFLRNYIDFFHFVKNNNFLPFVYNNYMNIRYWGDLCTRRDERNKRIVKLSFGPILERRKSKGRESEPTPLLSTRERLRRRQTISSLINALLNETDLLIKQKAAETLGNLGATSALPALIEALNEDVPEIRQESAIALGELASNEAVDYLIDALKDDTPQVVQSAAYSLMKINARKAIFPLIDALQLGNTQIAATIAFFPTDDEQREHLLDNIRSMLSNENIRIVEQSCFVLAEIGNREDIAKLVSLLSTMPPDSIPVIHTTILRIVARTRMKNPVDQKRYPLPRYVFINKREKRTTKPEEIQGKSS